MSTVPPSSTQQKKLNSRVSVALLPGVTSAQAIEVKGRVHLLGIVSEDIVICNTYHGAIQENAQVQTWHHGPILPVPLHNLKAIATDTHLYVVGGISDNRKSHLVYSAAIAPNGCLQDWVEEPSLPVPLSNLKVIKSDKHVFLIGATSLHNEGYTPVYRAPILTDGRLGKWVWENSLPESFSMDATALCGNILYVFGKEDSQTNVHWVPQVWTATISEKGDLSGWRFSRKPLPTHFVGAAFAEYGWVYVSEGSPSVRAFVAPIKDGGDLGDWVTVNPENLERLSGLSDLSKELCFDTQEASESVPLTQEPVLVPSPTQPLESSYMSSPQPWSSIMTAFSRFPRPPPPTLASAPSQPPNMPPPGYPPFPAGGMPPPGYRPFPAGGMPPPGYTPFPAGGMPPQGSPWHTQEPNLGTCIIVVEPLSWVILYSEHPQLQVGMALYNSEDGSFSETVFGYYSHALNLSVYMLETNAYLLFYSKVRQFQSLTMQTILAKRQEILDAQPDLSKQELLDFVDLYGPAVSTIGAEQAQALLDLRAQTFEANAWIKASSVSKTTVTTPTGKSVQVSVTLKAPNAEEVTMRALKLLGSPIPQPTSYQHSQNTPNTKGVPPPEWLI